MLDKAIGLNSIGGAQPLEGLKKPQGGGLGPAAPDKVGGLDFKATLDQIKSSGTVADPRFGPQALKSADSLKFSNHAIERMRSRGISFAPDEMKGIEAAISKAAQKGAKDTLVLSGENALIVSVKNNTVVTVMDRAAMKDNVFTNIDSTVVI
jgi:flagellar operon protein